MSCVSSQKYQRAGRFGRIKFLFHSRVARPAPGEAGGLMQFANNDAHSGGAWRPAGWCAASGWRAGEQEAPKGIAEGSGKLGENLQSFHLSFPLWGMHVPD